ncbi:MAG: zinc-binding dehydrogenase, partial [Armatimonadetes bacterium]|nr:zinc-binding dehydrogenase [Armatimonadota bacterium]
DALLDVRQAGEDELEAFAPDGPELVIEAAGRADVLRRALELVAPAGVVVTLMITAETVTLPVTELIIRKEVDLRGARLNRDLFGEVVELLSNKVINPRPLITHRFPLSSAAAAFRLAIDKPGEALKVLLQIED